MLFESPFDSMDGLNALTGNWRINGGQLSPHSNGERRLVFGEITWTDMDLTLTATLTSGGGYGVYYRCDGRPNITGYCFQYDPGSGNKFSVIKVVNGQEQNPFQSAAMPSGWNVYNVEHTIRILVSGEQHTIFVDGTQYLSFTDGTFTSGDAGLRAWNRVDARFNHVRVTRP